MHAHKKDDTWHYHLSPFQIRAERCLGPACDWLTLSAICRDCSLICSAERFHQASDDGNKPLPTGKLNWLIELCTGGESVCWRCGWHSLTWGWAQSVLKNRSEWPCLASPQPEAQPGNSVYWRSRVCYRHLLSQSTGHVEKYHIHVLQTQRLISAPKGHREDRTDFSCRQQCWGFDKCQRQNPHYGTKDDDGGSRPRSVRLEWPETFRAQRSKSPPQPVCWVLQHRKLSSGNHFCLFVAGVCNMFSSTSTEMEKKAVTFAQCGTGLGNCLCNIFWCLFFL